MYLFRPLKLELKRNHYNELETCSRNELRNTLWEKCSDIPECVHFQWIDLLERWGYGMYLNIPQ